MELLVLAILILCNGVFAMSEMAVVSSRKARLQQFADEGRSGAAAALALANKPAIFLSTIQVGITVIGITSGAFGEATLAQGLSDWLSQWPAIDPYSDQIALGVVVAGITFASLIVGELVPKRIALVNPESVASLIARPMRMLSTITYPVVRLLSLHDRGGAGAVRHTGLHRGARHRGGDQRPDGAGRPGRSVRAARAGDRVARVPPGRSARHRRDDAAERGGVRGSRPTARGQPPADGREQATRAFR